VDGTDKSLHDIRQALKDTNFEKDVKIEGLEGRLHELREVTGDQVECLEQQIEELRGFTCGGQTLQTIFAEGDPRKSLRSQMFDLKGKASIKRAAYRRELEGLDREANIQRQESMRQSKFTIEREQAALERAAEDRRRKQTTEAFRRADLLQYDVSCSSETVHSRIDANTELEYASVQMRRDLDLRKELEAEARKRNSSLREMLKQTLGRHNELLADNVHLQEQVADLPRRVAQLSEASQMGRTLEEAEFRINGFEMAAIHRQLGSQRKKNRADTAELKKLRRQLHTASAELSQLGRQTMEIAQVVAAQDEGVYGRRDHLRSDAALLPTPPSQPPSVASVRSPAACSPPELLPTPPQHPKAASSRRLPIGYVESLAQRVG
jgi:hypothetical protein